MYIHIPLILFLFANVAQTDANLLSRSSESLVRVAARAHKHAIKRSSGLARDLRLSFRGILATDTQQQPAAIGNSRVYCVNSPGPALSGNGTNQIGSGNGTSISSGSKSTSSGSAQASSIGSSKGSPTSSTSASTPTGSPTPASPWKIAQQYVSVHCFLLSAV